MLVRILGFNKLTLFRKIFYLKNEEVLKAYLQVIPPKRIYEIVKKQQNYIQDVIQQKTDLSVKKMEKYIKRRMNLIDIKDFSRLMENIHDKKDIKQYESILNLIYRSIKRRAQTSTIEDLVEFIYKLAKRNIRQPDLMKQIQDVIIEEKIKISYPFIRKILWTYTHLDLGTPTLYSHICKTIKVGQFQLSALQLAQSAYLLSKVSESAIGGYGIFVIAEKHLNAQIPRLDFQSLVEASSYMLTQNIGSNQFQVLLQQQIYRKYPNSDKLNARDLVSLLRSTSGYYFKYKDAALLYILRGSTLRMMSSLTLEHFEEVLWSWGRSGKADKQLWQALFAEANSKINLLKPRQIAFFYYSLCSAKEQNQEVLKKLQDRFLSLKLQEIDQHLLIKFLLGTHRRKDFNSTVFEEVSQIILKRMICLSNKQLMMFVKILNESDIDYTNKNSFKKIETGLIEIGSKLVNRSYCLTIGEIIEICYLWTKLQIKSQLINELLKLVDKINDIPKSSFIKAMFCYVMRDQYLEAIQMLGVLEQLDKYGPIGYFFSPYQFPLLGYCLFHMAVKVKGDFKVSVKLLQQVQNILKQTNPSILNQFVKKGYNEAHNLINMYNNKK